LMQRFYRYYDQGLSTSEALQKAQQEIREIPEWQHPYFWGGFVVQGEWR